MGLFWSAFGRPWGALGPLSALLSPLGVYFRAFGFGAPFCLIFRDVLEVFFEEARNVELDDSYVHTLEVIF